MKNGLIARIFDWGTHPVYSDGAPSLWLAGLVLVIIASFLWSTVVRQIE